MERGSRDAVCSIAVKNLLKARRIGARPTEVEQDVTSTAATVLLVEGRHAAQHTAAASAAKPISAINRLFKLVIISVAIMAVNGSVSDRVVLIMAAKKFEKKTLRSALITGLTLRVLTTLLSARAMRNKNYGHHLKLSLHIVKHYVSGRNDCVH